MRRNWFRRTALSIAFLLSIGIMVLVVLKNEVVSAAAKFSAKQFYSLDLDLEGLSIQWPKVRAQNITLSHEQGERLGAAKDALLTFELRGFGMPQLKEIRVKSLNSELRLGSAEGHSPTSFSLPLHNIGIESLSLSLVGPQLSAKTEIAVDVNQSKEGVQARVNGSISAFRFNDLNLTSAREIQLAGPCSQRDASTECKFLTKAHVEDLSWGLFEATALDLDGTLQVASSPNSGYQVALSNFNVRSPLITLGIPISEATAIGSFSSDTNIVQVKKLQGSVWNGTLKSKPFAVRLPFENCVTLPLTLESVNVKELLNLYAPKNLSATGILSATLPLEVCPNGVSIKDGDIHASEDGGTIRYLGDALPLTENDARLSLVHGVLQEFHYSSLHSNVQLSRNGDLTLDLRLEGNSPRLNKPVPIVVNLKIEENIPALIQSLRVAQTITENVTRGKEIQ